MNISITKTQIEEVHEVVELLQNISEYRPEIQVYKNIRELLKNEMFVSLVAKQNNLIVGHGSLLINSSFRGSNIGFIEDVVVKRTQRSRGIGQMLVQQLISIAEEKGCYKVTLCCSERNVDFYSKNKLEKNGVSMSRILNSIKV